MSNRDKGQRGQFREAFLIEAKERLSWNWASALEHDRLIVDEEVINVQKVPPIKMGYHDSLKSGR